MILFVSLFYWTQLLVDMLMTDFDAISCAGRRMTSCGCVPSVQTASTAPLSISIWTTAKRAKGRTLLCTIWHFRRQAHSWVLRVLCWRLCTFNTSWIDLSVACAVLRLCIFNTSNVDQSATSWGLCTFSTSYTAECCMCCVENCAHSTPTQLSVACAALRTQWRKSGQA